MACTLGAKWRSEASRFLFQYYCLYMEASQAKGLIYRRAMLKKKKSDLTIYSKRNAILTKNGIKSKYE